MCLNTGEDGSQQDGNEGEEGGKCRQLGEGVKGTRHGANPGNDSHDGTESDGADTVVGDSVEVLGTDEAVESLVYYQYL